MNNWKNVLIMREIFFLKISICVNLLFIKIHIIKREKKINLKFYYSSTRLIKNLIKRISISQNYIILLVDYMLLFFISKFSRDLF